MTTWPSCDVKSREYSPACRRINDRAPHVQAEGECWTRCYVMSITRIQPAWPGRRRAQLLQVKTSTGDWPPYFDEYHVKSPPAVYRRLTTRGASLQQLDVQRASFAGVYMTLTAI
jgi:hypothetical protein